MQKIEYLEPWEEIVVNPQIFEEELYTEVGEQHALYKCKVKTYARRCDRDTFLFRLMNHEFDFAVVHLTFKSKKEENLDFPMTKFYRTLEEWIEKCMLIDNSDFK